MTERIAQFVGLGSLRLRFMLTVVLGAVVFSTAAGAIAYRLGHSRAMDNSRNALNGLSIAVGKTAAIGAFARRGVKCARVCGDGGQRHARRNRTGRDAEQQGSPVNRHRLR